VQPNQWDNQGNPPYWALETQLVNFNTPAHTLDAAVDNILAPSADPMQRHWNPSCSNARIVIKNTGTTPLTSLRIDYGLKGTYPTTYQWAGNLNFLDTMTVSLPPFAWNGTSNSDEFYAIVSQPNGGTDQYAHNDTMRSRFAMPIATDTGIVIRIRTNNNPTENSWEVYNEMGNVVASRSNMAANTLYSDTLSLWPGCYRFVCHDTGEDGLNFFASPSQGSGTVAIRGSRMLPVTPPYKYISPDFGKEVSLYFRASYSTGVPKVDALGQLGVEVYPNPADSYADVAVMGLKTDATLRVFDVAGRLVLQVPMRRANPQTRLNLEGLCSGIYSVQVQSNNALGTAKLVK
jgi:hypothetical protein